MKHFNITVNGTAYNVQVEEVVAGAAPVVAAAPAAPVAAPAPAAAPAPVVPADGETVECPMPGTIMSVDVTEGASVKMGDVLVVLEAMKMENEIKAPRDGKVVAVHVRKGDTADSGTPLVTIQ